MATIAAEGLLAKSNNRGNLRRRYFVDRLLGALVTLAAALGVALLAIIIAYIVIKGLPAWNLEFFIGHTEPVGVAQGGVGQAIVGSLMMYARKSRARRETPDFLVKPNSGSHLPDRLLLNR